MTPASTLALHFAGLSLATLVAGCASIWAAMALWYRISGSRIVKASVVCLWGVFSLTLAIAAWRGHGAICAGAFVLGFAGLLVWWCRLRPTNCADWADDVSRMSAGEICGNRVTLHNVRNFDWRTNTDYTQRWETRTYDLDGLRSVDMVMSYWRGPAIAHMVTSFGFDGGAHVAFSVEIRRRRTQQFSEIGGFFKDFELSIIAADEYDVIRLRSNVRGERVFVYRLILPEPAVRRLFLAYVAEANKLVDSPRFYNTVTVNCTTLVYQMMRPIVGHLPLSYRLLFSGYMPEYAYRVGGFDQRHTLEELRSLGYASERARQSGRRENFSSDIRRGVPAGT
jgi:hypothetical protein